MMNVITTLLKVIRSLTVVHADLYAIFACIAVVFHFFDGTTPYSGIVSIVAMYFTYFKLTSLFVKYKLFFPNY